MKPKTFFLTFLLSPLYFFGQTWTTTKQLNIMQSIITGYYTNSGFLQPPYESSDKNSLGELRFILPYKHIGQDSLLRGPEIVTHNLIILSSYLFHSPQYTYQIHIEEIQQDSSGKVTRTQNFSGGIGSRYTNDPETMRRVILKFLPFYSYPYLDVNYNCFDLYYVPGLTPDIKDEDYFGLVAAFLHTKFPSEDPKRTALKIIYYKDGIPAVYTFPEGTDYSKYLNRITD